jgi:hypothetical protein
LGILVVALNRLDQLIVGAGAHARDFTGVVQGDAADAVHRIVMRAQGLGAPVSAADDAVASWHCCAGGRGHAGGAGQPQAQPWL